MGSQWRLLENQARNKRHRRKQFHCDKKASYRHQADARAAAETINRNGKIGHGRMRAYECHVCGRWHLTSQEQSL